MDDVSFKKELTALVTNKKALGRTKDKINLLPSFVGKIKKIS